VAEQWVRAYAMPIDDLFDLVGSRDLTLLGDVLGREDLVDEVDQLLEEMSDLTVERALGELVGGSLKRSHVYAYVRTLEVILETRGTRLSPDEVVLPGRGWQLLRSAFGAWGMATLADRWCGAQFRFPWRDPTDAGQYVDWPIPMALRSLELELARKELAGIGEALASRPLPGDLGGLEAEAAELAEALRAWAGATIDRPGEDLLLFLDGQQ
jgi:hypothetical protein